MRSYITPTEGVAEAHSNRICLESGVTVCIWNQVSQIVSMEAVGGAARCDPGHHPMGFASIMRWTVGSRLFTKDCLRRLYIENFDEEESGGCINYTRGRNDSK